MKYILYLVLISTFIFAQSTPATKDSLQNNKQSVKQLNQNLRTQIDSLKMLRDSLQQKLREELRELYIIKYGTDAGGKVAMGQIWTGMTEEMMQDSWGAPDSVTENNQKWGRYSQWYYGDIIYFFKDGKLFEWENEGEAKKN